MRSPAIVIMVLALASGAMAHDLGVAPPVKPAIGHTAPPPDPGVLRQGGDTIVDAVPLSIPTVNLTGSTAGYTDIYDEVCPYSQSTSPDVVYSLTPVSDHLIFIDMAGSAYDTKIYVYDAALELVACNDDYYPDYTSRLEDVPLAAGETYYLVIDGYGGDAGDYIVDVDEWAPCELDLTCWGEEGEPPLGYDYEDLWNGGCNTDPVDPPFSDLIPWGWYCGVSGWYLNAGSNSRDTDWYLLEMPFWSGGVLYFYADAEQPTYLFELGPQDCDNVGVLQTVEFGPCQETMVTITAPVGSIVWIWIGPTVFESPDGSDLHEYEYVLDFGWVSAVEDYTLTEVKALFD